MIPITARFVVKREREIKPGPFSLGIFVSMRLIVLGSRLTDIIVCEESPSCCGGCRVDVLHDDRFHVSVDFSSDCWKHELYSCSSR